MPAARPALLGESTIGALARVPAPKAGWKNITLDALTDKEQGVLCVIGDGSDDLRASERLGNSPHTVNTHRKAIMAKLSLYQKGELIMHALQQGYVWVTPEGVFYPGFQRRLQSAAGDA